ncbi:MAG: potassium transporter Kup [Candidatus Saccharibacteria bacterium]|nr:potassium transporter Kup [Candidatus Saccharibacteria bacterium]
MLMVRSKRSRWLVVGAIGVVFGDIGTSPLYAIPAIFGVSKLALNSDDITGVISLILWSVTLVVSIKYVGLMMRADNNGEGGIMALIALASRTKISSRNKVILTLLALVGVSLFYGDSVITPAISVLSAVEGVKLVSPDLTPLIIPLTVFILAGLFLLQARGTGSIGRLFGPIMVIWFVMSAAGGLGQIIHFPSILSAISPLAAVSFFVSHPAQGFVAMGAVVLAITGAEALYADMGQFGRPSIRRGWFLLVFPALILNYLGQGALVIQHPEAASSSYFLLFPSWLQLPVILVATAATLIASQAVITGAFSLTRQAVQLGFAPRLTILHTSRQEFGQVYVPTLNWAIAAVVLWIVVLFGSSAHLAGAYGMAVSGTLAIDTILLLVVMRQIWKQPSFVVLITALVFVSIDILFITSSATKLLHGAWLPISIAVVGYTLLTTWYKGHTIISHERARAEGTLRTFVQQLRRSDVPRIPGYAVYLGHHVGNAPLALHETLEQLHEMHEKVVVVAVQTSDKPHVAEHSRVVFDGLGHPDDGISHVTLQFGYMDTPNVPKALEVARSKSPEVDFDPYEATYFTSISQPVIVHNHRMVKWRKALYLFMDRNANNPSAYFKLPLDHTVEMRTFLEL